MKRNGGYTLIEILIVIAILATVVLMAAPLSGGWINASNLQESEGQLREAVSRAKSLALRNAIAAKGGMPVSAVCLNTSRELSVRQSAADTPLNCALAVGEKSWQASINEKMAIKHSGTAFTCVCFDNKALVTQAGTCSTCSSKPEFELIPNGSEAEALAIY